jgi:hypothetical protein
MAKSFEGLVQSWLPKDDVLLRFYSDLDDYMNEKLNFDRQYEYDYEKSKIIADPVLGYIGFSPIELYIIDSPIFQRLRYIRQLGLSYLVFPSLNYSRFEHSLGVVGWIEKIINKISDGNGGGWYVDKIKHVSISDELKEYGTSLRLAGLLHDIGHCIFSHCSERVMNKICGGDEYVSSEKIREIYTDHFSSPKLIPFAEILSLSIIGSKRFHDYLKKTEIYSGQKIEKYLKYSAYIMLGLQIDNEPGTVFLGQILSSGLDADKLDYMTREQLYSGIKLEIDLERILSKLQVFSVKPNKLPRQLEYLKNHADPEVSFKVLGFEKGGQFSFEEFCVSRLALHVKIYLHQKIRIAEAQIERYLDFLVQDKMFKNQINWLRLTEDIIHNQKTLVGMRGDTQMSLFYGDVIDLAKIAALFNEIGRRELYARAYAFGPINKDGYSPYQDVDDSYNNPAIENTFDKYDVSLLKSRTIDEVRHVCDVLGVEYNEGIYSEIIVDLPRLINIQQGQETLYFDGADMMQIKWTIPIDKIMHYYQNNRALGYIYTKKTYAHIVALSAEKVFFEKYGEVFSQEMYLPSNVYKQYMELKEVLVKKDYYKKCPQIKGVSRLLKNAASAQKIREIYDNLSGFKSIIDNQGVSVNRIYAFLNQFPFDLQECALEFISHLKVYNDDLLIKKICDILEGIEFDRERICFASLGGVGDSGSRLSYSLRGILSQKNVAHVSVINDDVIANYDCLIFYDDNINSGKQLFNIIGDLLGEKEKISQEDLLTERHLEPLKNLSSKEKIKNMEMYFVYILGFSGIQEKVREKMNQYFGFSKEKVHVLINNTLYEDNKIFSGENSAFEHPKKDELRKFLEDIGRQLLERDAVPADKIKKRKLGYAMAEAMVLFPYNVPTMTITPIWYSGKIEDDVMWYPLAERRRRGGYGALYDEE